MSNELLGHFSKTELKKTVARIEAMKSQRRDYIYPAKKLSMTGGQLTLSGQVFQVVPQEGDGGPGICYTEWKDAEVAAEQVKGKIVPQKVGNLPLNGTAESQLAEKLNIPIRYVRFLKETGKHVDLLDHNVTTLLSRDDRKFFIRSLADPDTGSFARAFLSTGYRVLDNCDLFFCAAEEFQNQQVAIQSARLWDDGGHFELFAYAPGIVGKVRTDRPYDPGDGWMSRWKGEEGDVQNAGIKISNSETGEGGLNVRPCILTRVCANYCIWGTTVSQIHLGKRREEEGLILSDDTKTMEWELTWKKVRDAIRTAFNPAAFQEYIDAMNKATARVIADPVKAVDNVVAEYAITEERKAAILTRMLEFGDRTQYGLLQSVTFASHQADQIGRPDEASQLEQIGGKILELNDRQFAALVS
jgi:hypothetical protein